MIVFVVGRMAPTFLFLLLPCALSRSLRLLPLTLPRSSLLLLPLTLLRGFRPLSFLFLLLPCALSR
jgi:hypothetical protein